MSLHSETIGKDQDRAARTTFLKITPFKWLLVRAFENFLKVILPLLPAPRVTQDKEPKSILVVEYWNLGDLAIAVPFLRNLRQSFPSARISLLVNQTLVSFLEGQGIVDEFIPSRVPWAQHFSRWKKYNPFSSNWISLVRTIAAIRKKQFDWAVSARMDIRDNSLLWLTGAPRRFGYGFAGGAFLLTDCIVPDLTRPHRADIWLNLLRAWDSPPNGDVCGFRLSAEESSTAKTFLEGMGIPSDAFLIGIHSGARQAVRRWGDERFATVARNVLAERDVHILWFSDPRNPSQGPSLDRCHNVSLEFHDFLAVLSHCRLLICNDSGPMHIANLLEVPVVAVFGPQRPEWFGPRGTQDRVVIHPEFSCRPCFDYCLFDQPYCLRAVTPQETLNQVNAILRDQADPFLQMHHSAASVVSERQK